MKSEELMLDGQSVGKMYLDDDGKVIFDVSGLAPGTHEASAGLPHAPPGTVQLMVDGQPAGTMRLNDEGKATFDVGGLVPGTHELVAVYPEQERYEGCRSEPVTITVK
jgi:hypothetical protein